MKTTKPKSLLSQGKKPSRVLISLQCKNEIQLPTPKDFDNFLPWLCLKFEVPQIVIIERVIQEEYKRRIRRPSSTRLKLKEYIKKDKASTDVGDVGRSLESSSSSSSTSSTAVDVNALPMKTFYNNKGNLVEVAFINSPSKIHGKVIRAINLCLPFHPTFYKFTVKGGGLTQGALHEMAKLLPYSNITDVCLDDNTVAEGNYHVLLDKETVLQNLSLRRCKINDEICVEIANKLNFGTPASNSLLSLDLTSNQITDVGAQALGTMLRRNRMLAHLSIADNKISDIGAFYILSKLQSFLLTKDDLYQLKGRHIKYCLKKIEIYKQCEQEIMNLYKRERKEDFAQPRRLTDTPKKVKSAGKLKRRPTSLFLEELSLHKQVEKKTKEIVGEFRDIFDDQNVTYKDGKFYAIGNLKLCSLNIAYNNVGYLSVRKLYEVLKYQNQLCKPENCKGLLRVVLDGNNIPKACEEFQAIESYLGMAVTESIATYDLSQSTSTLKSSKKLSGK